MLIVPLGIVILLLGVAIFMAVSSNNKYQEQKNNVQVFNLVMKDSVEEKIIELQKRKKELADMFVENNSGGLSQMSKEDILSLFTM